MKLQFISTLLWAGLLGAAGSATAVPLTYTYTPINVPGSQSTALNGLNNAGQIVGTYRDSTNTQRLFLDNNGAFITINPPGGVSTAYRGFLGIAAGINDLGQIAGTTTMPGVNGQGFIYSNGQFSYVPLRKSLPPPIILRRASTMRDRCYLPNSTALMP